MNLSAFNSEGIGKYIDLKRFGLSSFAIKIIALISMVCDHVAIIFFSDAQYNTVYNILRMFGKLSFPLFCFILVEGFYHTSNKVKHALLLFVFAVISEVPFDLMLGNAWDDSHQNVMFTLFIGYLLIWGLWNISMLRVRYPAFLNGLFSFGTLNRISEFIITLVAMLAAHFMRTDYELAGILLIMGFYAIRKYHIGKIVVNFLFNFGLLDFRTQWFGMVSAVFIALYNGKPGKYKWKYFFYIIYPLHLLMLVALKMI